MANGHANGMQPRTTSTPGARAGMLNGTDSPNSSIHNGSVHNGTKLQNGRGAAPVVSGTPVEGQPDWAAYTAPDGRSYYYNASTGVSAWEKPGSSPASSVGVASPHVSPATIPATNGVN